MIFSKKWWAASASALAMDSTSKVYIEREEVNDFGQ